MRNLLVGVVANLALSLAHAASMSVRVCASAPTTALSGFPCNRPRSLLHCNVRTAFAQSLVCCIHRLNPLLTSVRHGRRMTTRRGPSAHYLERPLVAQKRSWKLNHHPHATVCFVINPSASAIPRPKPYIGTSRDLESEISMRRSSCPRQTWQTIRAPMRCPQGPCGALVLSAAAVFRETIRGFRRSPALDPGCAGNGRSQPVL
jgi:hypothetical protein